ncbi:MAG: ABC transporter permease [Acidobacteria bacterium]|nr:ABC transporter permease [Acidobacteriota bacterium]
MQQLIEAARIAMASIWAHKLRSFLTLLGVIIGVSVVIAVATLIEGANVYVDEKLAALGSGVFFVNKASVTNVGDFEKFLEQMRKNPNLDMQDVDALAEQTVMAEHVGALDGRSGEVRNDTELLQDVGIQGCTPNMIYMSQVTPEQGRYVNVFDQKNRRPAAFLGSEVSDALFPSVDPVGREVRIDGLTYTVVGVAKKMGTVLGQSQDNFVILPLSTYLKVYGARRSLTIYVKARPDVTLERAQDDIRTILRARHQRTFDESDDFAIVNDQAIADLAGQITGIVAAIAIPITLISLVVGGIVIMNIMLVVVTERTREIGIRKSLGARRNDILMQFLVEAVILSGTGGAIGVVVAYSTMKFVSYLSPIPAALPVFWSVLAVALSAGVGLFFGIYPAMKASKLDPIVALRAD